MQATSTYDAAHLYVVEAKKERAVGLPKPTLATVFEVVTDGKVYRVKGEALQKWIVERRQKSSGPKGYMFTNRPWLALCCRSLNAAPCADCYVVGEFNSFYVVQ